MKNKRYLFISDFDKTLSLSDSGYLLSEKIGLSPSDYRRKVYEIRERNIAQLGGELACLIVMDEFFKGKVTKELFHEVGREIRLKKNVAELFRILQEGIENKSFLCFVTSAGPREIIVQALVGLLPPENIFATTFNYDDEGYVAGIQRTGAGDAKVATVDALKIREKVPRDQIVYIGDGTSDVHVMLHVKAYNGYPIAVSTSPYLGHISKRTVLSDNALSILIPILEDIIGYPEQKIMDFFSKLGIPILEWNRARVEWVDLEEE